MATRSIVTSQPDVPCDVCGRRLLRGEQPDVFLAGGQRRTVCELCAPRASHEGWLRETRQPLAEPAPVASTARTQPARPPTPQREPVAPPSAIAATARQIRARWLRMTFRRRSGACRAAGARRPRAGGVRSASRPRRSRQPVDPRRHPLRRDGRWSPRPSVRPSSDGLPAMLMVQRALEVFNAGEHPRRVAGVARSLGEPSVTVRPPGESGARSRSSSPGSCAGIAMRSISATRPPGRGSPEQGTELSELAAGGSARERRRGCRLERYRW